MQSFSTWDKRKEYTISPFNPYVTVQKINVLSSVPSGRIPYLLCLKSVIQSSQRNTQDGTRYKYHGKGTNNN